MSDKKGEGVYVAAKSYSRNASIKIFKQSDMYTISRSNECRDVVLDPQNFHANFNVKYGRQEGDWMVFYHILLVGESPEALQEHLASKRQSCPTMPADTILKMELNNFTFPYETLESKNERREKKGKNNEEPSSARDKTSKDEKLQEKIGLLELEMNDLKKKNNFLQKEVEKLSKENTDLKKLEIKSCSRDKTSKDEKLQERIELLELEMHDLQMETINLKEKNKILKNENEVLRQENKTSMEIVNTLSSDIKQIKETVENKAVPSVQIDPSHFEKMKCAVELLEANDSIPDDLEDGMIYCGKKITISKEHAKRLAIMKGLRPKVIHLAHLYWGDNVSDWALSQTEGLNFVTHKLSEGMTNIINAIGWIGEAQYIVQNTEVRGILRRITSFERSKIAGSVRKEK